ncbi:uncharacterized protein LOC132612050 [Lycium barbarum]|uniref:uncharacterized protein LOC132612050 n=1 Tax=Lycium barbarum TaxID=112863 RepID=UPI00293E56A8|nr:uncharacterized protein LOC132612050 [Lycium barbarum]
MPYAGSNCNGKIWFFVQHNVDVEILLDTEQSITVKLQFQDYSKDMVVTMVYAKCSEVERLQLWDNLYLLASNMTSLWLVGGDFNVLLNQEEKIRGQPVWPQEYEDFAFCLNSCELHEIPFKRSPFTWWNGRAANDCIFKRLDRMLYNDIFQNWFGQLEAEHLLRTSSDHAPLLQWDTVLTDDAFLSFKLKMKKLKTALSTWSKTTFGDIFKQLVIREEIVKIKEQLFEENPSEENRMVMQRAQAELKLYLHYEEEFLRQKARMDCFSEGDKNTRYFHSLVKGRRKRIQIRRIKDNYGNWLEDVDSVAAQAVNFFHKQFTHEEMAVFELNGDSSCGPDGFSGIFYQKCWEVIKADVYSVVKAFFEGQTLPKSITHTHLVLLPKKNVVETFSDMRPISLSNFINKAHGFFHSTRGFKQGDPISPALFIIAAEVLSRALNSLFDQSSFVGYGMPKWSADLNHLAYVDDTIIFSSADSQSLQMIMDILQEYEKVSGQMINKRKSSFYLFSKVSQELSEQVETITGFVRGHFPFTYLGVPITHARKRKVDYTELLKKIKDRLQTWKGKLLSYGGKAVLITSVIQSIPIHVLSAIRPPKCVIKELHRIFAGFFWNNKEDGRCRHWAAWLNMCIPKHEGGLGFKSIYDTSKALCAKLWWKFRTTSSLWDNFMWNKYCKKQIPQVVQWKEGSQVWKMMLEARESIEQEIWWEPKIGSSNIWFDNWTKLGALNYVVPQSWQINEQVEDVSELMTDGKWNISKLMQLFPEDIVQHIIQEIDIKYASNEWDRPW